MNRTRMPASVLALLATTALARLPIFNDARNVENDVTIMAHRERQAEVNGASQDILNKAESEKRDLTEAEQKEVQGLADEYDSLENQIGLRARVLNQSGALNAPRGRVTAPEPVGDDDEAVPQNRAKPSNASARAYPQPRVTARGTNGFRNMGDFAAAVYAGSQRGAEIDPRLRNAGATTYGSEAVGADGGFAVPPDFQADIMGNVFSEDSLVMLTNRLKTASNSLTVPVDETTAWESSGGIRAYWGGEAQQMTQSKPKLSQGTFKCDKLHCLVPVTEELLENAPALDGWIRQKAPEAMDYSISDKLVRGTGAGMPLGILNSGALVTQAAVSGQAADTVVAANISAMWSRMPARSRRTAVWLCNPDVEPQFDGMVIGNQPVYVGPNGLRDDAYGRLKGRPVIPHQACASIGDLGDLILVDWNDYMTLTKVGNGRDENGMKFDVSTHLWFDFDEAAFKFTIRLGGQPWRSKPITPANGSNTQSPFVVLAAR